LLDQKVPKNQGLLKMAKNRRAILAGRNEVEPFFALLYTVVLYLFERSYVLSVTFLLYLFAASFFNAIFRMPIIHSIY
jgi:hypothetical protein